VRGAAAARQNAYVLYAKAPASESGRYTNDQERHTNETESHSNEAELYTNETEILKSVIRRRV
jgi:hypothetical protein